MPARVLIVDDEPNITLSFSSLLRDDGYEPLSAASAEDARTMLARAPVDLILLDIQLPGVSGLDLLRELKAERHSAEVLMISGQADIPMALEAVRLGALDFLEKPVQPEKLLASVSNSLLVAEANRQRAIAVEDLDQRSALIGESTAMRTLKQTISRVAPSDTTVLITGPNGTGKELVATRLYLESNRRDRPFIKVNCPGIPETLFESELFGHVKGAFTGAVKDHPGKFVMADGGTIFLDEIGDLPLTCQAKLLRVLETGEVETLGAEGRRQVDVRVICATNRDLGKLIADGKFREDLYYRVSVFALSVPPLADRRDDIPLLIGEFLRRFDPSGETTLSGETLAWISARPFGGNVRELKNLIERLCILHRGDCISVDQLNNDPQVTGQPTEPAESGAGPLAEQLARFERTIIREALQRSGGNISEAARLLEVNRANLSKKVKELGLKTE
ncbi:response regulator [candidate division GN15 bacterium]|nr:response regulator [candidate division GN15 bacterium]